MESQKGFPSFDPFSWGREGKVLKEKHNEKLYKENENSSINATVEMAPAPKTTTNKFWPIHVSWNHTWHQLEKTKGFLASSWRDFIFKVAEGKIEIHLHCVLSEISYILLCT